MLNRQIQLVSRPVKGPAVDNFALRTVELRAPVAGEILLRTLYLSLDPYMRARMYDGGNYAASAALGEPMVGSTVSIVAMSNHPDFRVGDYVESGHGWQEFALSDGAGLRRIDPDLAPVSTALGILGMPGQTGYTALMRHGQPRAGETLVVSAASGAVGSVVGQVAEILGCRVVGIAGGPEKCRFLTDELGFDAAVDHRSPQFSDELAKACPSGIDIYYDNVGGRVFETVLPLVNAQARILVCGTIAVDRNQPGADGTGSMQALLSTVLVKRLSIRGFIYSDDDLMALAPEFRTRVGQWLREGRLRYREQIVHGLENAPEAFLGLFRGDNFGKLVVKVSEP
ncbi:NADP-dependent oxidoreductase [Rhizobium alvei]|uniref:NADP-dependent oxidoreductase n=1 Tax=Rhizobium alvei TaxID=1132659 RepID=A0ABT8YGW8_9HYPH|nr:NADP-dependent oxidoreductase [Rhizobium alvei]MDO6962891.1 NADP-dependent oxidoreductase [Rhizobium alvei]